MNYQAIRGLLMRQMKKGLRVVPKIAGGPDIIMSMHDEIEHWQI